MWESTEQYAMRRWGRKVERSESFAVDRSSNFRPHTPPELCFGKPFPFAIKYWTERGFTVPSKENNYTPQPL